MPASDNALLGSLRNTVLKTSSNFTRWLIKGAANKLIYLVANKSVEQCKASFTNLQTNIFRVLEFELSGPRTPGRDLGWQSSLVWLAAYPRGEPYLNLIAVRSDR